MPSLFHKGLRAVKASPARKVKRQHIRLHLGRLNGLLAAMIVVAGVTYLAQANSLVTKGYHIRELEQDIKALEQSTRQLELQAVELRSIEAVQARVSQLNMEAVTETEFLAPTPVAGLR
jgi:hypothetical protein